MIEMAVIGRNGLWPEVTGAGVRVLEATAQGDPSLEISFTEFP
jgi:tartrate dehydrogenase/decarboxylase / D-malate dehydrogenase